MFPTSTLRTHAASIALAIGMGCAMALASSVAAAGDKPAPAASARNVPARPCLIASEHCRDLDSTPFTICYTATRCDQQSQPERLARGATYAIYR